MEVAEARIRDLEAQVSHVRQRRAEIIAEYASLTKAEILEALADALVTLEAVN